MNKLLPSVLLLITTYAQAQTSPNLRIMQHRADSAAEAAAQSRAGLRAMNEAETRSYQRRHDSMEVLIDKRRKEIEVYNRAHPIKKSAAKSIPRKR